ncbi:MAG: ADP-ribosylglycohydrolase family protein, partial [Bacteroidota bacterium]|nr:ADP-ribosylglycohydrolase family protein [Bacteroidota bacterium]
MKTKMPPGLKIFFAIALIAQACAQSGSDISDPSEAVVISKDELRDRIKGAWAAQTIGVTFGAPIEFQYNSTMVQDNQRIEWNDSSLAVQFRTKPGTYDDIYMDLTFMQVIEDNGIDATAEQYAQAIGGATYKLWFANQMARYNIQNGLTPPQSGHWLNNPCADDIDFQIEADFAGLMSPGMINSAIGICDKVGHIMNYGDGYYGGVFIASLYATALVSHGTEGLADIVKTALKPIPAESKFSQCIQDVLRWHAEEPGDWKATWYQVNRKWSTDTGSPLGIFKPFNIDAKINAAWVVLGLLYGNGDFTRTFEITTRCGDDADCNPASAGGVLAAIVGYKGIPDFWKSGLEDVADIPFMGTSISLNQAYDISYR